MRPVRIDQPPRTALITGAHGFLAGFIIAALRSRGWRVIRGVRSQPTAADERHCDFAQTQRNTDWHALLDGVDAVVNVAGILRETRTQTFEAIHHAGPLALAQACVAHGVRDFVQISALGDPADGEFIASKHRFDAALLDLELRAVVLRPSIVYTTRGSYGGTSLLRALSALPVALPLPGAGEWPVQPLAAEDLGELVAAALEGEQRGVFEVGCERPLSLRDYLLRWRAWLRIPGTRTLPTPLWAVDAAVAVGERFSVGPRCGACSSAATSARSLDTRDCLKRLARHRAIWTACSRRRQARCRTAGRHSSTCWRPPCAGRRSCCA